MKAGSLCRAALSVSLCASMLLNGCATQPTNLSNTSTIQLGATRAEVEQVLGKPIKSVDTGAGSTDTYRFYARAGPNVSRDRCSGAVCAAETLLGAAYYGPLMIFAVPLAARQLTGPPPASPDLDRAVWARRSLPYLLEITYGPDDTVTRVGKPEGDPDAQYEVAKGYSLSNPIEEWKWLCRAADQGHAEAQLTLGTYLEAGAQAAQRDLPRAYMWYDMAGQNGLPDAKRFTEALAESMTPEQLAEANRLLDDWQPGLCYSEMEAPGDD